jgi:S-adenosylmethionine decarboxylase
MRAEEWLIDIDDADVTLLTSPSVVRAVVDDVVDAFDLTLVAEPLVHAFPATSAGPGGVTTLALLAESHVALHTWPEHGGALLSVGTCRCGAHDAFDWASLVQRHLGARARVTVRRVERALSSGALVSGAPRVAVGGRR